MANESIIQEVKHLLSTGQRASISTKTFEKLIELLEQKEKTLEKIKEIINSQIEYCSSCENGKKDCEERFCEDYIARDISIKIKSVLKETK